MRAGSCFPPASPPSLGPYGTLIPATARHKCTCVLRVTEGQGARADPYTRAPECRPPYLLYFAPHHHHLNPRPRPVSRFGSFRARGALLFSVDTTHQPPSRAHTNTRADHRPLTRRPPSPRPGPPASQPPPRALDSCKQ